MQVRRFTLRALVPVWFLLLALLSVPAFAAPAGQVKPPSQGQTTAVANLRSGPGTTYAKVGSLPSGKTIVIKSCNKACDWYQLEEGAWIAAFLVVPVEEDAAGQTSTSVKSPSALPTATALPTISGPRDVQGASAQSDGNLRAGPGTDYDRVGGVKAGQTLDITGRTAAGDWYQLADGNWIAALLVTSAPADVAVVEVAPPAATPTEAVAAANQSAAAAPQEDLQTAIQKWQERVDFDTIHTCGHFEYRLTDVRRKKSVWLFNREYVAQGDWLMVFVEVKNISPGTSYFGQFSPRLIVLTTDGRTASSSGDAKASSYASWMFQHGRFYEDINPGQVLGLVEAYDLPLAPDLILGFSLLDCPDDLLSLGMWSNVAPSTK